MFGGKVNSAVKWLITLVHMNIVRPLFMSGTMIDPDEQAVLDDHWQEGYNAGLTDGVSFERHRILELLEQYSSNQSLKGFYITRIVALIKNEGGVDGL